ESSQSVRPANPAMRWRLPLPAQRDQHVRSRGIRVERSERGGLVNLPSSIKFNDEASDPIGENRKLGREVEISAPQAPEYAQDRGYDNNVPDNRLRGAGESAGYQANEC